MPQNMRGVRANDLIPGRNERIPVYIDGFRRPKFEKKNNYARAESGFCITYSERSQIRRRVLRSVLAETAREHVSRAMTKTSRSRSLVTHFLLYIILNTLILCSIGFSFIVHQHALQNTHQLSTLKIGGRDKKGQKKSSRQKTTKIISEARYIFPSSFVIIKTI